VFAEVWRALKPGAPFIVTVSDRCFSTKAVAVWLALKTNGHAWLVRLHLERAGCSNIAVDVLADGSRGDPLVAVTGRTC